MTATTTRQRPRKQLDVDRRVLTTTELTPPALDEIRLLLGSEGEGLTDEAIVRSIHQLKKRVQITDRMDDFLDQAPSLRAAAERYHKVQRLFRKKFDYYKYKARIVPRDIRLEEYIEGAREIIEILAQYGPLEMESSLKIGEQTVSLEEITKLGPEELRNNQFRGKISVKNDLFEATVNNRIKGFHVDNLEKEPKALTSGLLSLTSIVYAIGSVAYYESFVPVTGIATVLALSMASIAGREFIIKDIYHLQVSISPNQELDYTPEQVDDFKRLHRDLKTYKI